MFKSAKPTNSDMMKSYSAAALRAAERSDFEGSTKFLALALQAACDEILYQNRMSADYRGIAFNSLQRGRDKREGSNGTA